MLGSEEDAPLSIKKHKLEALGGTDSQRQPQGSKTGKALQRLHCGLSKQSKRERVFPILFKVYSPPLIESGTYSQSLQGHPV